MMNRWIILAGIGCWLACSWGFAADVLIDDFNGPFPGGIDEDWGRCWPNGTWLPTNADYISPPDAQAFAIYVGDTCDGGCDSAISYGPEGDFVERFHLRDFAPDIDATKPWSLICYVSGHNDGARPDYFLGYWSCEFLTDQFSGGTSEEYTKVYWTTANDRTWDQVTFSTAGSTSGDDVLWLSLWVRWGPKDFAGPTVQDSYVAFDDVWLTYTPDNGDVTPPGQVIGLAANRGDGQIELTWQNPSDADFAGTLIRVRTDHFPVSKWNGDLVVDLPGSPGAQESFVHQPADNDTSYYYAAYTYDNRTTPSASYANYSEAATAEAPGPEIPTVDGDIDTIENLGWDVVNHGDEADPTFKDSYGPTGWDTTTETASGDTKSAILFTPGTSTKWRQSGLSPVPGLSMFFVWKPGQGMKASASDGVWGRSAHNVVEIDTAGIRMKISADSNYSMYDIPVPDGLTDIALHDSVDVEQGGLGTQFHTFTISTDVWHRWWVQVDGSRNFKLYEFNDLVHCEEDPHLLASGTLGSYDGDERITFGESTTDVDADFLVDEVYVLNSFRDVSEVPWPLIYPDYDCDGYVNEDDLNIFQDCATGPGIPYDPDSLPDPEGCDLVPDADGIIPTADFDRDRDVDQEDFGRFQKCISGNTPGDPACMEW